MALVPGLRPITEDRPDVERSRRNARVESPELRREAQLRPTANPVDTFVRAPAPPQDNQFLALARGLGALNPALNRFLDSYADSARPEAEAAATRKLGGMTFEEARDAMKKGEITELQNPWFRAGWMKQFGQRMASWRAEQNATAYENDFDKDNDSADRLAADGMKEDLEAFGDDKHFVAGYTPTASAAAGKLRSAQAQYKSERLNSDTRDNVYSDFLTTVKAAKEDGKSPEEIQALIRGKYKGNRELLNVPNKDQDREVLRVASSLADEGDFATAKALLESDRTGDDGTKLGALKDNREFAADALRVLALAERERDKRAHDGGLDTRMSFLDQAKAGKLDAKKLVEFHKANPGVLEESDVTGYITRNEMTLEHLRKEREKARLEGRAAVSTSRLLSNDLILGEDGRLPFLGDGYVLNKQGERVAVSGEKRREQAISTKMELEDAEAARQMKAAEKAPDADAKRGQIALQTFNRKVDWLSRNGAVNPQWKNVMEAGAAGASIVTTSGADLPPSVASGFETYKQLHAKSPRLLGAHLKDGKAIEFYEAARVAEQYLGQDQKEALQTAVTATRGDFTGDQSQALRLRQDDLRSKARGTSEWFGRNKPANESYAMAEIEKLGGLYLRLGLSTDNALTEAAKVYKSRTVQVNGTDLYLGDRNAPPDFAAVVEQSIRDFVEDNPDEGLEADDIVVAPGTGTGVWSLIDRTNGRPIRLNGKAAFTFEDLTRASAERLAKKAAAEAERPAMVAGRRAAAAKTARDFTGKLGAKEMFREGSPTRWLLDQFDATAEPTIPNQAP
ncbi:hypothetical protein JOD31_001049 [Methylopila capsulata]|uniref:Uncharacterized protein n=1 Tax=Methylopila capsulata TaxID=61654 RepID=A0A9W6ITA1_9HYPH|nr:hypothetical protein [Methylopila capsulata]MBM7850837.1 hypothetical protein [Methylopila capsulata]GLK56132.1 hypothetical protein GCM10008170_21510 [Methylopila capsulata]